MMTCCESIDRLQRYAEVSSLETMNSVQSMHDVFEQLVAC